MISVVVTVRNEANNIRDLLDSLIIQEDPMEIIIVDAGSDDGTQEIVREYKKRFGKIKMYVQGGTRGEGRNYGIKMAKGEVVAFTDGDCIANPFWIKEIRKSILEGADIVAGKTVHIGYQPFVELSRVELFYKGVELTYPSCNLAYRKKILEDIGGFDPWFRTAEDIDLNFRAVMKEYRITYNERVIIYHRERSTFMGFFKQALWNGYGRKQLTLKHGSLWHRYSFSKMFKQHLSTWYVIRMIFAIFGYLICKVRERCAPYGLEHNFLRDTS